MNQTIIKIEINPRPESSGLRILSTEPKGIYASCSDRKAVIKAFEFTSLIFACERELIDCIPGSKFAIKPDWDKMIEDGFGELVIRTSTLEEIADVKKIGEPIFESSTDKYKIEKWRDPYDVLFIIIRDNDEYVDSWLIEKITADMEEKK